MSRFIGLTYDDGCDANKYLIDKEDERFVYMTNSWTGQEMRYDKSENNLAFLTRSGSYKITADKIIQADMID